MDFMSANPLAQQRLFVVALYDRLARASDRPTSMNRYGPCRRCFFHRRLENPAELCSSHVRRLLALPSSSPKSDYTMARTRKSSRSLALRERAQPTELCVVDW